MRSSDLAFTEYTGSPGKPYEDISRQPTRLDACGRTWYVYGEGNVNVACKRRLSRGLKRRLNDLN